METIEKSVEVLNDLIEINNDRIAGFEHAIKGLDTNDSDLQSVFESFSEESRKNVQELTQEVARIGGDAETGHSASGTIHRTWLDVKATFSGHDRKSVLEECERGEDAIKRAYRTALTDDNGLTPEQSQLITRQQESINRAHDRIKALRDSQS